MTNKKTAVLIPCYNEALTIAKVIEDYKRILPDADIYVCDNNSTDGSDIIAEAAGAKVMYQPEQGKGNVLKKMFKEIDADYYITVDADDTYPVDKVPEMIRCMESTGADMVIGDRLHSTYFTENKRPFHNFGNRLVRALINFIWSTDISDIMTGSRIMSRKLVKSFPSRKKGFEVETELTCFALNEGMRIESVVIPYQDRVGTVSKLNTYRDGAKVLLTILQCGMKKKRRKNI